MQIWSIGCNQGWLQVGKTENGCSLSLEALVCLKWFVKSKSGFHIYLWALAEKDSGEIKGLLMNMWKL